MRVLCADPQFTPAGHPELPAHGFSSLHQVSDSALGRILDGGFPTVLMLGAYLSARQRWVHNLIFIILYCRLGEYHRVVCVPRNSRK
jgi:hypothetical protein